MATATESESDCWNIRYNIPAAVYALLTSCCYFFSSFYCSCSLISAFQQSSESEMNEADTTLRKQADSLFKSGKFEGALELYQRIPDEQVSHLILANKSSCYAHLQHYDLAESAARSAIAKVPSFVKVY